MSWINSNATYKQNSKNDLSFYHGFSKTPVEPTSTGTAATTLGNASTKGGHTVIGTEVWAEEIPWFGLVPSRAVAVTRLSGLTKLNDLVKVDGEGGKVYKYKGADDAIFTEDTWADFWEEVTLTNGMTLNNRHKQPVLRYYLNQPMQTLTTTNNASIDSKGFATRLFVDESNHTGQTSGGSVVSQFAAGTDNIKNGIPSVELNPKLYLGTTEKIAGTHYYDYNVSGTILWSTAVTSSSPKISCFRYIGKTVTGQLAEHLDDISDIKAVLGIGESTPDNKQSVTERVETVEDAVKVLLGLDSESTKIEATESIATTAATTAANAITTSLAGETDGTIGYAIASAKSDVLAAIDAIQHFSVEVVPVGQKITDITLVENTIYLVSEDGQTSGTYVEYIAYKPKDSETVTYEKIGSTALDLSGYTTDAEYEALAGETGRVTVVEGKVTTLDGQVATITSTDATKPGSIAKALADAKKYAEEQAGAAKTAAVSAAKVTLTPNTTDGKTGIEISSDGEGPTSFTIGINQEVIATKSSVDDLSDVVSGVSQTVASIQTELSSGSIAIAISEAKTAAQAAQDAADAAQETANQAKSTADTAVQTVAKADGSSSLLTVTQTGTAVTVGLSDTVATKSDITTEISNATSDTAIVDNDTSNKLVTAAQVATYVASEIGDIDTGVTSISINSGAAQKGAVSITALTDVATASHTGINSASIAISNESNKVKLTAVSAGAQVSGNTLSYTSDSDYLATADDADVIATFRAEEAKDALADTDITGDNLSVTGSGISVTLGGKVGAPTLTGSVATATYSPATDEKAGSWTDDTNVTTGAEVAKAIADVNSKIDTLHSASVSYKVFATKPEPSAEFKGIIALVPADSGDSADSGDYVEWLCVETEGEGGAKSYSWEQIGTTAANFTQYAKSVTVNGTKTSVTTSTGDINLGKVASSVTAGNGIESGSVSDAGALSLTLTSASTSTAGITKLTADYNDEEDDKAATGKSIAAAIETLGSSKSVNGVTVTQTNGVIESITEELITAYVPEGTTSVEGNVAYVGTTKHVIAPEKFQTAAQMPSTLTSWVADLSNLTNGDNMFNGCTSLTVFVGDLSSLTSAVDMFNGCTLNAESLEILAENLPTVSSGTIDIGASTNATDEVITEIKDKGWTLNSNGVAL